ncbi:phage tail protein [Corynebacterium sp.]|uniref:phage tail protein n=1 Tax=Corynebacterium sp. TaxID=1720 RepID=UPI0028ACAFBF|nr:phage tail protein [Corynebacterium sp.]
MTTPTYRDLTTQLRLVWVDTEDVMSTQRAIIEVTPDTAYLELPRGRRGEKGEKGDPGAQLWWRYIVSDRSELPADLALVDEGAAFPCTGNNSLYIWDGYDYLEVPNFIGMKGETGDTPRVRIGEVRSGDEASVIVDQAASTDDLVVLDFTLPRGQRGAPGDQGPPGEGSSVSDAPDVDLSQPPSPGEALVWNGTNWAPRTVLNPMGPFALGPSDFSVVNVGLIESASWSSAIVASMTVPGLPFDWRPMVQGGLFKAETPLNYQVDVEVRVGNAQQGDIIGYGVGKTLQRWDDPTLIRPFFPQTVTPGSAYGVVEANTATTIYVVAKKAHGGVGAWKSDREWSSLVVMAQPVVNDL